MQNVLKFMLSICVATFVLSTGTANAHMTFKKELQKKYPTMKVSCNACHVKGKPKTDRSEFGKLFFKELKPKKISATYKTKKGAEKKKYEADTMIPAFKEALKKIKVKKNKAGDVYDELIKTGKIPEIKAKAKTTGG